MSRINYNIYSVNAAVVEVTQLKHATRTRCLNVKRQSSE